MGLRMLTAVLLISVLPVLVRLVQSGLHKPRNLLVAFVSLQAVEAGVSVFFGPNTAVAYWVYVAGSPLRWVLFVALISEIYSAIFSDYPGIRTALKSSMLSALAVATLISGMLAWSSWREHAVWAGHLYYFELAQRSVLLTLIFFVVLLFVLVSRYPLRPDHNLLVSSLAFSTLFVLEAVALLFEWIYPLAFTNQINAAMAACATFCYMAWALNLRSGAAVPAERPVAPAASHEEDLLRQLSAINSTLLRAFGR